MKYYIQRNEFQTYNKICKTQFENIIYKPIKLQLDEYVFENIYRYRSSNEELDIMLDMYIDYLKNINTTEYNDFLRLLIKSTKKYYNNLLQQLKTLDLFEYIEKIFDILDKEIKLVSTLLNDDNNDVLVEPICNIFIAKDSLGLYKDEIYDIYGALTGTEID